MQAILDYPVTACLQQVGIGLYQKNNKFLIHFLMKMKSFHDYLGLSNSCSYDVNDVIGRADRFGFQNFCSPGLDQRNKTIWVAFDLIAYFRLDQHHKFWRFGF